jgi:hypothetical protein
MGMKAAVESFVHRENIKNFKKRLKTPVDDTQRKMLLTLLAEEEAKAEHASPKHFRAKNNR